MRRTAKRWTAILAATLTIVLLGNSPAFAEGNAAEERVLRDAKAVAQQLNDFWAAEFKRHGVQYVQPAKFEYYHTSGNTPCGEATNWARNAFYCHDGNFVDFDIDWFTSELEKYPGDMLTWWVLAHEWGHSVQHNWWGQQGVDHYEAPYRPEVQADCLAGAFFRQALLQGTITLDDGDPQALITTMAQLGDGNWYNPGTHGSPQQRLTAFSTGLQTDPDTCRVNDGLPTA